MHSPVNLGRATVTNTVSTAQATTSLARAKLITQRLSTARPSVVSPSFLHRSTPGARLCVNDAVRALIVRRLRCVLGRGDAEVEKLAAYGVS